MNMLFVVTFFFYISFVLFNLYPFVFVTGLFKIFISNALVGTPVTTDDFITLVKACMPVSSLLLLRMV